MNPPDSNDPLDQLLRERNEHVDDNGFTARVVRSLPRRRSSSWLRLPIILGAACISLTLVLWLLPTGEIINAACSFFGSPDVGSFTALLALITTIGSFCWGLNAVFETDV